MRPRQSTQHYDPPAKGDARRRPGEEGAVAVIAALTLSILVLMAAFVVDLGLVRVDTGRSQSTADMAAAAGADELDVITEWNARQACEAALAYAESNLGAGASAAAPVNSDLSCLRRWLTMPTCNPADPRTAEYTLGRYRIEITIPVPDNHPLMGTQALVTDYDGEPCERVGVSVQAERDYILAGVGGFNQGESTRSAVGRAYAAGRDEALASLIVLRPNQYASNDCNALLVNSNNTTVQIGSVTTVIDGEDVFYPGVISAYSVPDNSTVCTGNNQQVFTVGSLGGGAYIRADGLILSYGLDRGALESQIFQAGAVASGALSPRPRPGPPTMRSTIDHLYNCNSSYPSGPSWSPASHNLPYNDCDEGPPRPYIEALHAAYQNLGAAAAATGNWVVFPNDSTTWECNDAQYSGTLPADVPSTRDPSRWYINCPGNTGPNTFQPNGFNLVDVDRVVFNGEIRMTAGSSNLRIDGGTGGATVYIQTGDVTRNSGDLRLQNMSLYVDTGRINLGGNAGTVELRALPLPSGTPACAGWGGSGAPPADCFERLAAWGNKAGNGNNDGHVLGGGSSLFVQGIFFSPNNFVQVNGSGDTSTLNCDPNSPVPATAKVNLRDAQLWSSKIVMGGSGSITLCPSPTFAEPIEIPGSSLIRGTG
jgi:hypothetical protein